MSALQHRAILVSSTDRARLFFAWSEACRAFEGVCGVSPIDFPPLNAVGTFVVFPDGSKRGRKEAARADRLREAFLGYLEAQAFEDGSNALCWFEGRWGEPLEDEGP